MLPRHAADERERDVGARAHLRARGRSVANSRRRPAAKALQIDWEATAAALERGCWLSIHDSELVLFATQTVRLGRLAVNPRGKRAHIEP